MTEAPPKVELKKAVAFYSSVLPDMRYDGLFPNIALDCLNSKYEFVYKVKTAVSGCSDGETSTHNY